MAAGTRRSTRLSSSQASQNSSPSTSQTSPAPAGKKRKAESGASPSAKRGKQNGEKQQTIEDVMDLDKEEPQDPQPDDKELEKPEPAQKSNKTEEPEKSEKTEKPKEHESKDGQLVQPQADDKSEKSPEHKTTEPKPDEKQEDENREQSANPKHNGTNGHTQHSEKTQDTGPAAKAEDKAESSSVNGKAVEPHSRDSDVPASILEKGVMYFLYRGRVNIDSPDSVTDIQRSFLLLRPLPHGAKLGDGSINTSSNDCRLIAIPKKTLPTSGKDRWTGFVEKAKVSFPELKENFLKSSTYDTQTQGTQTTPSTAPAAEGIYAITTTGRETHLAYIITLPSEMGEIQHDLGIRQKGSFILSTKNPKASGPSNADLGTDPGYSEEIQKEFRSLRWMPTQPRHLDYEYCQFLMIGEGEQGLEKATEPQEKDVKNDKSAPLEEMEKLEGEDELRIKHLDQEDAVFKDLGMDSKSYPGLQTTW